MTPALVGGGKAVALLGEMRECALLVLTGCLVTTEGPVVVSSDPIIAIAANDFGVVWAEAPPGRGVTLWALERGTFQLKLGAVAALDRIALIRHEVYATAGHAQEIVGAEGKFLVVRTGDMIQAFDPVVYALDHDPWTRTYSAAGAPDATVGHGMLAVATAQGWRTFELGGSGGALHAVGAHAPTLVRPIADGIAFGSEDGLFTSQRGVVTQIAEADHWAHLVEMGGALWAATAPGDAGSRFVRIEDGVITELDAPGDVVALAAGGGRLYVATKDAIYRAD